MEQFELGEHLDLSKLTDEQIQHITKEFDYMMWLSYLKDDDVAEDKEKREALEAYMHAYYMRIAVLVDCYEKRNHLIDIGVIQDAEG